MRLHILPPSRQCPQWDNLNLLLALFALISPVWDSGPKRESWSDYSFGSELCLCQSSRASLPFASRPWGFFMLIPFSSRTSCDSVAAISDTEKSGKWRGLETAAI